MRWIKLADDIADGGVDIRLGLNMRGNRKILGASVQRRTVRHQDLTEPTIKNGRAIFLPCRPLPRQINAAILTVVLLTRYIEGIPSERPMAHKFSGHRAPLGQCA